MNTLKHIILPAMVNAANTTLKATLQNQLSHSGCKHIMIIGNAT